jgi:hypothetical protein
MLRLVHAGGPHFDEKWDLVIQLSVLGSQFWPGVVHVRNDGAAGPAISGCAAYE